MMTNNGTIVAIDTVAAVDKEEDAVEAEFTFNIVGSVDGTYVTEGKNVVGLSDMEGSSVDKEGI